MEACMILDETFDGTNLDVSAWMVYEGAGFESSFLPTPTGAFNIGQYDPNPAQWWGVNLAATPGSFGSAVVRP
jgi:hypothetical protein